MAKKIGIPVRKVFSDGTVMELQEIVNGIPHYYITENYNAARTISTQKIKPGGISGLGLTGKGVKLGIWDGGGVRTSHLEFSGRAVLKDDPATIEDHATHVAGTMIAKGILPEVYPNPFKDGFYVNPGSNESIHLCLFDLNGRLVYNSVISGIAYVPAPHLVPGMYILELIGARMTEQKKMIRY